VRAHPHCTTNGAPATQGVKTAGAKPPPYKKPHRPNPQDAQEHVRPSGPIRPHLWGNASPSGDQAQEVLGHR
jgi:hypothetical protein